MRETEFSVSGGKVNATGDRGLTPASSLLWKER